MKAKIIVDREMCKGCGYCITACPHGLIDFDDNFNAMGYHPVTAVNGALCNGCGLCSVVCPDVAIEVWVNENKRKKTKARRQK
ncbi:4Fe-4S dicluster domain-containing protein [bacterium]|nr:MAG: 4Fe-4S dicluster domain-containing protein [bacterium]